MAFRDPLEAAAQRAAELADAPVAPTHAWIAENLQIEIDPDAKGFTGPTEIVDAAQRAGLRYVGRKSETNLSSSCAGSSAPSTECGASSRARRADACTRPSRLVGPGV